VSKRVVVVGGGFAGFWAALAARRIAPAHIDVVLISREPVLQMRPRLYETQPERLQVDLLPLLETAGVDFVRGEATVLDHCARRLVLGDEKEIQYARLVVATGSTMRRPPIPGAQEAYSIDTAQEAIAFDRRLAEIVRGGSAPTIAVVGAGFTGIELALELRDRIVFHGAQEQAEQARILLVDRAEVVGPELGAGPRPLIEAALAEARIELRLGATVTAFGRNRLVLAYGETIDADAVILTTGMTAASFARKVPGKRDELGRIVVSRSLRAPTAPDVFVAGDAAAADGGDDHVVLQSCQHALQLGRFAGENAARDLLGQPLVPYLQPPYITCLDLGRSGAVFTRGWERTVELTGAEAKAVKRRINTQVIYPPHDATRNELLAMSSVDVTLQRRPRRHTARAAAISMAVTFGGCR
jgi:NADH:ubiquinone reductase (H+-translocating)